LVGRFTIISRASFYTMLWLFSTKICRDNMLLQRERGIIVQQMDVNKTLTCLEVKSKCAF